jgi:recombinational DNA repair protein (RecF pathway)
MKRQLCADCGTPFTPTNRSVRHRELCLACAFEDEEPERAKERAEAQAKRERGKR